MLRPSDLEPVAAGDSGAASLEGPSAWVLELGEAARRSEFRSELHTARGHHLRAWSSRRSAARARRRLVQELLAKGPAEPGESGDEQLTLDFMAEADGLGPALRDRIAAYTVSSP